jgi:hypothetical protein
MGYRLRTSRCTLAWSIADAAKYFQVTERTWHNWESGAHRIPFAVYKLCRVLARLELPGAGWAGWSFQGGKLITPEGRQIEPRDGAWWSLLVRNANAFMSAYNEARRLRLLLGSATGADAATFERQAQRAESGAAAGLVSYTTNGICNNSKSSQDDVIIESWPILCDFLPPSTPLHAPRPNPSGSALTPSFALPWTSTCAVQLTTQRPAPGPHLVKSLATQRQNDIKMNPSSHPQSSPEPKSRRNTNGKKQNLSVGLIPSNALTSAATAAKL